MAEKTRIKKKDIVKQIIEYLKNGVEENGEIREFDIFDYYQITKLTPRSLYLTVVENEDDFTDEDRKLFYSFVVRSLNDTKLQIKELMSMKHIVVVDDIPREITDEEKMGIINYLKDNKLPRTSNMYAIVLKKYLEGDIVFEKNIDMNKVHVR